MNDYAAPIEQRCVLVDFEGDATVAQDLEELATRRCATVNPPFVVHEVNWNDVHPAVNAEGQAPNAVSRKDFLAFWHAQGLYQRCARSL
jgi:hypothetical protein